MVRGPGAIDAIDAIDVVDANLLVWRVALILGTNLLMDLVLGSLQVSDCGDMQWPFLGWLG